MRRARRTFLVTLDVHPLLTEEQAVKAVVSGLSRSRQGFISNPEVRLAPESTQPIREEITITPFTRPEDLAGKIPDEQIQWIFSEKEFGTEE